MVWGGSGGILLLGGKVDYKKRHLGKERLIWVEDDCSKGWLGNRWLKGRFQDRYIHDSE